MVCCMQLQLYYKEHVCIYSMNYERYTKLLLQKPFDPNQWFAVCVSLLSVRYLMEDIRFERYNIKRYCSVI